MPGNIPAPGYRTIVVLAQVHGLKFSWHADVANYQRRYTFYAADNYCTCNDATLRTTLQGASLDAKLLISTAPAEYCLPVKKDRRFSPVFQVKARPTELICDPDSTACSLISNTPCSLLTLQGQLGRARHDPTPAADVPTAMLVLCSLNTCPCPWPEQSKVNLTNRVA